MQLEIVLESLVWIVTSVYFDPYGPTPHLGKAVELALGCECREAGPRAG